ncbi:MAG TPA: bifunctional 4-hydroxy-2-oxoglutarate aldolase/2-dehydro-3-deoxy-phosphogluconate aldolase [Candidatus Acidoferrum sp.]|nr:bifunctional 4-hydroxy-2-oxoglutarate aldolase/2-dehydro-3-deoxy-phosphogluconate aldolase [Candidatus Acidoferrum sp.]
MKKEEIRARIEEIGIIPAVRVASAEHACYAAETVCRSGIPIAEITMTVPHAFEVISDLVKNVPEMIVGAGTVLDVETAQACVDAGAHFLTSTGFVREVVEFAQKKHMLVIAGALTPTELIHAWKAGSDMIKIFPCAQVGGASYIHTLKVPFPYVPLIAAGGVDQQTAFNYILAGASALGIGGELIPKEALQRKQEHRIRELARRFLRSVKDARNRMAGAEVKS